MEEKRKISLLIPYKFKDGKILLFIQKRAKNAARLPGHYGFFGGEAEGGENSIEALYREIKEELDFTSDEFDLFKTYEFGNSTVSIFLYFAQQDFELKVTILEGDYGRWLNGQELLDEPRMAYEDKLILHEVCNFVQTQNFKGVC